jgi:hypothetical protein
VGDEHPIPELERIKQIEETVHEGGAVINSTEVLWLCEQARTWYLKLAIRPVPVPRLSGAALQKSLIDAGIAVCRLCKGTGAVFDAEDEEVMGCGRCGGSGKFKNE